MRAGITSVPLNDQVSRILRQEAWIASDMLANSIPTCSADSLIYFVSYSNETHNGEKEYGDY